jgi:hypothetical protein
MLKTTLDYLLHHWLMVANRPYSASALDLLSHSGPDERSDDWSGLGGANIRFMMMSALVSFLFGTGL